jgi:hypothetical protein
MIPEKIFEEISSLPPEGQHQVMDFIAFIRHRYGLSPVSHKNTMDVRSEAFIGMWRDRDDLKDSRSYVRRVRQSEWTQ